jgi:hypothetical protein
MKRLSILITVVLFCIIFTVNIFAAESSELSDLIANIELGNPIKINNITVIPIYQKSGKASVKLTLLDEALNNKMLEISELDGGSVPQVRIKNRSDKYIYLMGGEIITGCKQDRIIAKDVIIQPKKELVISVFCVEQGRWTSKSGTFYSKKNMGTYKMRKDAQKNDSTSQSKIWNEVRKDVSKNNVKSGSTAYQDIYEDKEVNKKMNDIEKKLKEFESLKPDTVGAVIALGDKIISTDIFANPEIFKYIWPKIIKSSVFSSINEQSKGSINNDAAVKFLNKLKSKDFKKNKGLNIGEEYSIDNKEINALALTYNNAVIHVAEFPADPKDETSKINNQRDDRINLQSYGNINHTRNLNQNLNGIRN